MRYLTVLATCFLLGTSCKKSTDVPPPAIDALYFPPIGSTEWATTTPESLGWNTANLQPLYDYLIAQDTRAFVVLKNGKIVVEKYFGQNATNTGAFTQNSLWQWASAGKTLTSFIIGKAQQEGLLNINHKTSQYLGPGWTAEPPAKEALITIRHQLTMTTGLDDGGGDVDDTTPAALVYKADAGTRWAYHNAPYTLLQKVVSHATGQPFANYFEAKLKSQIGMDGQWRANGYLNVYWSTPRSMARFGLLMLAKAKWDGREILGDSVFYQAAINSSQTINPAYGYLWWLNGKASYMVAQSQLVFPGSMTADGPADMVAALGKDGQLLNVVPSKGLVVVRMGNAPNTGLVSIALQNAIWDKLKAIIK